MVAWALLATALVSIPIITHGNVGITQFGYRFSLDFQLLLFVILATVVARGWTRLHGRGRRRVDRLLRLRGVGDLDRLRGVLRP